MDITIKCPNCFQQVSRTNRFCTFCGYDITRISSEPATLVDSVIHGAPESISAPYDGPCYCPKGHDVPDPSLGFCPTCGSPLVNELSLDNGTSKGPEEVILGDPPHAPVILSNRQCKRCGFLCEDSDLNFCPACGYPLDDTAFMKIESDWTCACCGATNSSDMSFCTSCGRPRGRMTEDEPEAKGDSSYSGTSSIPEGMNPPTDKDLKPKAMFGN